MASPSLKTIASYALVLVGVATLVILSSLALRPVRVSGTARARSAPDLASTPDAPGSIPGTGSAETLASSGTTCMAVQAASVSPTSLRQAQLRGRELFAQQHYDEALVRFRSVAAMDAALPGINLDLSSALLKLHQNEAAQRAVNTQISTSECLARLSPNALDAYCRVQLPKTATSECRQELTAIARSAHFQSALVQMALGNTLSGAEAPSHAVANVLPSPRTTAKMPTRAPHPVLAADEQGERPKAPAASRRPSSNPLAGGAGTDADLGAYSKQP